MLQLKTAICLESLRLPLKKAIDCASRIGAEAVEINGRTELRPREMTRTAVRHLKKILTDRNLAVCSYSFPTRRNLFDTDDLDRRLDATRQAMSTAYELGARIVSGSPAKIPDRETEPNDYQLMLAALTDLASHGQKVGCWYALSTSSSSPETYRELMEQLPPGVAIDFDPAGLIMNGHSPDDTLKQIGKHVMQFRARDAVRDLATARGIEVQLGRGSVDLPQMLGVLEEHQFNGHFVIERNSEEDPIVQCGQAIEYLRSFF